MNKNVTSEISKDLIYEALKESWTVETIEDANLYVGKWVMRCNSIEEFKLLKNILDTIRSRYLHKKYSYEATGKLEQVEEDSLRLLFDRDFQKFWTLEMLIDSEMSIYWLREQAIKEEIYKESDMQKDIINNFKTLFPDYFLVEAEHKIDKCGRIDILAGDSVTGRDVIIELKRGKGNPNRQLLDYGTYFVNPILIGITQEKLDCGKKKDNILYYTYDNCTRTISEY